MDPTWVGSLSLDFSRSGARTVVSRRRHSGPLLIQRAFHEPDGSCQIYLIHPPGGVVGGDRLSVAAVAEAGARVLITTPAATKLYRSQERQALLDQHLELRPQSLLEWLPLETIAYDGAYAETRTRVTLAHDAQFIGWEITCLGRDAVGFSRGRLVQSWKLEREGRPLWSERLELSGGSPLLAAAWGLAGRSVVGTLVATGAHPGLVDAIREFIPSWPCDKSSAVDWFSVSLLGEVLVCRYLGYSAEAAKHFFCKVWALVRAQISGRQANPPRVWAT